jgi:hypothetical protein
MLSPSLTAVQSAVRRSWLLVVVAAVAAAAVGFLLTVEAGVSHTARSVIAIDWRAIVQAPGSVEPDYVLQEATLPDFAEAVAVRVGDISASEVSKGLSAQTFGRPYKELEVTFTAENPEEAERVARAAGEELFERIQSANAAERERYQSTVDSANELLAIVNAYEVTTPLEEVEMAARRYSAISNRDTAAYYVHQFDTAYVLEPSATVREVVERDRRLENSVGAGVLGIAVGIGLAVVRERVAARHAR